MKPTTRQWLEIAAEDLDAGRAMFESGRYLYAGFQAHQAAEKALKAVIQEKERIPPRVHDLEVLGQRAGLVDDVLKAKLKVLTAYYEKA